MTADRLTDKQFEAYYQIFNDPKDPVTCIGIDPGISNGIGLYNSQYLLRMLLTVHMDDMVRFLTLLNNIKICVYENFSLFPNIPGQKRRNPVYSKLETPQVIGMIKSWGLTQNIRLIEQSPSIKKNGYAFIGKKPLPKSDPLNHQLDAHVHFMYWAITTGKIKAEDLL